MKSPNRKGCDFNGNEGMIQDVFKQDIY